MCQDDWKLDKVLVLGYLDELLISFLSASFSLYISLVSYFSLVDKKRAITNIYGITGN